MAFVTIDDLRTDALWKAGEETGASVSDYYARALEYLDAVQDAVITGGSLRNVVDLPLEDWRWAKPQPRRTILLAPKVTSATITVTLTNGSAAGTFSADPGTSLVGYRLKIPNEYDVPSIKTHSTTTFTIDHNWQAANVSAETGWTAFKIEYQLPSDHVRLCSGLILQGYGERDVIDRATLDEEFPFHKVTEGVPDIAALVSERWIRFSHYPASPGMVAEYDAIVRPTTLESAADPSTAEPTLPLAHRRILSLGAAMLIAFDKGDEKYKEIFEEFQAAWVAMKKSNSRPRHQAARGYGYIKPRQEQIQRTIRYSTGGLPVLW